MDRLHFASTTSDTGRTDLVGPHNAPLKWLRVELLRLNESHPEINFETGEQEAVLDIFSGVCTVHILGAAGCATYVEIGNRANVFAGKPTMVYFPKGSSVRILADSATLEGAVVYAPARVAHPPAVVFPGDVLQKVIGKDNWQRTVSTSIGDNVAADRLIVGETINPPGNWSSSPPHKHDATRETEIPMEEVYLYKLNPQQGYGLQRIYTAAEDPEPFDVSFAVRDGDVVVLPRGYHPVVAAPGYQLFYLWALAGEQRRYGAWSDDPDHAWIKGIPR